MFKFSQKYTVYTLVLEGDFFHLTPLSINLVIGEVNHLFIDIPREDIAISLKDSYLELEFDATHRTAIHARYADGDHLRIVNLGLIDFFIEF